METEHRDDLSGEAARGLDPSTAGSLPAGPFEGPDGARVAVGEALAGSEPVGGRVSLPVRGGSRMRAAPSEPASCPRFAYASVPRCVSEADWRHGWGTRRADTLG
jgi:hypothetical protein